MKRKPEESAKAAKEAAENNELQACLVELADAMEGIAAYLWYIGNDLQKIKKEMNIS